MVLTPANEILYYKLDSVSSDTAETCKTNKVPPLNGGALSGGSV